MFNFDLIVSKMKDEELFKIPEQALRKIKSLKEYDDYFHELYKQGIEAMFKAEMGEHQYLPQWEKTYENN